MSTITSIINGIEGLAGTYLGADYEKIDYGVDLGKNRDNRAYKKYACLPSGGVQEQSIGALVMNQDITFRLTDSYRPGKVDDHTQQDTTKSLYDNVYGLYEYIVNNKCGVPSLIMNTFDLNISEPEYIDSEVTVIEFTFTIKHRLSS